MDTAPAQALEKFLNDSPWGSKLSPEERERVLATSILRVVPKGTAVVTVGAGAQHWVGIVDGLVAQAVPCTEGQIFLSAVREGAWFGEGTLLRHGNWEYEALALQATKVALVPVSTFDWLRFHSIPFNHFIQELLNSRLSIFTRALLSGRHSSIEQRVAVTILDLLAPDIYARTHLVRMSQSDLALLAGTSRQRANKALKNLEELKLLKLQRLGVEVPSRSALEDFVSAEHTEGSFS